MELRTFPGPHRPAGSSDSNPAVILGQGSAIFFFFCKVPKVNSLGFAGHTVSITTVQTLAPQLENSHRQYVTERGWQTKEFYQDMCL